MLARGLVRKAAEATSLLEESVTALAVKMHPDNPASPDLSFDLSLSIPDGPHRRPVITAHANGVMSGRWRAS